MSFTAYGGFGSNLFLELLAIKYGLLVVWDKGSWGWLFFVRFLLKKITKPV